MPDGTSLESGRAGGATDEPAAPRLLGAGVALATLATAPGTRPAD